MKPNLSFQVETVILEASALAAASATPLTSLIAPTTVLEVVANVLSVLSCLRSNAACCAVETGLSASAVLSTLSKPT